MTLCSSSSFSVERCGLAQLLDNVSSQLSCAWHAPCTRMGLVSPCLLTLNSVASEDFCEE